LGYHPYLPLCVVSYRFLQFPTGFLPGFTVFTVLDGFAIFYQFLSFLPVSTSRSFVANFSDGYPSLVFPTMHLLAESLNLHVISTAWDLQFLRCLGSILQNTFSAENF
jgi:hypothetical protein